MALLYWDPDGISGNNVLSTGAGLGGAGTWQNGGSSNWFNPLLNSGLGGYVSWNSSLGDTAVFAGLNGSNITITGDVSAAGLDFRGANVSISGGNLQTVAGGTILVATEATRIDSSISGSGGIQKTGSGSVTLGAALSTYTGDTLISGGLLDVRGTVQSHIRVNGGSVQGVMFYDPDLASSVREGLGVDSSAWLTPSLLSQAAPLTRLTADANRVDDITGISNLSSLTEFSLIPTDYSVSSPSIASLAPLAGLTNLTSLRLQDTGLTNTSLATLPLLPNLRSLDVRYNALSVVPSGIANLPRLASLQIHGNPLLSDNPRSGLAALKGKLIDVDVAPDRPEIASDIPDLAAKWAGFGGDVATGIAVGGYIGGRNLRVEVFDPPQGSTRLKITDLTQGRLKNGIPVGSPILRVDAPHLNAPYHHINIENLPRGLNSLQEGLNHTRIPAIPTSALNVAKYIGKPLIVVGVAADAADLLQSYSADVARGDGQYSATKLATGRVAGGWAGAAGGALIGAGLGSVVPVLGTALGGLVGGVIGGVGGAIGGSWVGETVAGWF